MFVIESVNTCFVLKMWGDIKRDREKRREDSMSERSREMDSERDRE